MNRRARMLAVAEEEEDEERREKEKYMRPEATSGLRFCLPSSARDR